MYRNPPIGIGKDQIGAYLVKVPLVTTDKRDVVEVDFDAQTVTFKNGAVIRPGDRVEIKSVSGLKVFRSVFLVDRITYDGNIPYLGPEPLYPMWKRRNDGTLVPWNPAEEDIKRHRYQ